MENSCGTITALLLGSILFDAIGSSLLSFTPVHNSAGHIVGIIFGIIFIICSIIMCIKSIYLLYITLKNNNNKLDGLGWWCQVNIVFCLIVIFSIIISAIFSSIAAIANSR